MSTIRLSTHLARVFPNVVRLEADDGTVDGTSITVSHDDVRKIAAELDAGRIAQLTADVQYLTDRLGEQIRRHDERKAERDEARALIANVNDALHGHRRGANIFDRVAEASRLLAEVDVPRTRTIRVKAIHVMCDDRSSPACDRIVPHDETDDWTTREVDGCQLDVCPACVAGETGEWWVEARDRDAMTDVPAGTGAEPDWTNAEQITRRVGGPISWTARRLVATGERRERTVEGEA